MLAPNTTHGVLRVGTNVRVGNAAWTQANSHVCAFGQCGMDASGLAASETRGGFRSTAPHPILI
jgi:hypothetical protein